MSATAMKNPPVKEVSVSRVFDAPIALVYRMWVEPEHLAAWWGPRHFTNPKCTVDARPGGEMNITMRGPDGVDYPMTAEFTEVVANKKLVFTAFARDLDGNPQLEAHTTVTFENEGGKTRITVKARGVGITPASEQMLAGMEAGWTQTIDKLGEHVAAQK
jgi:uncharacterized protein YndB with AHSA1/START domain